MALRDRLRRLEREARGEVVIIPQTDGTVKKFPKSALVDAYLCGVDRATGRNVPDHPLCVAARNSSGPKWSESFFTGFEEIRLVEDLSEP